jgi:hypothetical protein
LLSVAPVNVPSVIPQPAVFAFDGWSIRVSTVSGFTEDAHDEP